MRIDVNFHLDKDNNMQHVEFVDFTPGRFQSRLATGELVDRIELAKILNGDISKLVGTGLDQPHAHPYMPPHWSMWDVIVAHASHETAPDFLRAIPWKPLHATKDEIDSVSVQIAAINKKQLGGK